MKTRIIVILLLLAMSLPAFSQSGRRFFFRRKPPVERPQSSHYPQAAFAPKRIYPALVRPIINTPAQGVPKTMLGKTVTQLVQELPGTRLMRSDGERVYYMSADSVWYEVYNNHVVVQRGEIKGNWHYPDEDWYEDVLEKVSVTNYNRYVEHKNLYRFYYKEFSFSIDYERQRDTYVVRYEYLLLHNRFDELLPVEEQ